MINKIIYTWDMQWVSVLKRKLKSWKLTTKNVYQDLMGPYPRYYKYKMLKPVWLWLCGAHGNIINLNAMSSRRPTEINGFTQKMSDFQRRLREGAFAEER